jgi:hypothetical protein
MESSNPNIKQSIITAQTLFNNKTNDYGTGSWRIMRIISLADQLYIKAKRIVKISNGRQKVKGSGNNIESEFIGLINYAVIGIIQNKLDDPGPGEEHMPKKDALNHYSIVIEKFSDYFEIQNPHYVEEIEKLTFKQIAEILTQKIERLKKFYEARKGNCKILIFGSLMEILLWSTIGHINYIVRR